MITNIAQILGFASDTKLLIIHADDFGMCHSVNRAIATTLEEGTVSSASIMVPCPAFAEAAEWAAQNAEYDIGIHSTLISEQQDYKWGPVAAGHPGSDLVDERGYFWPANDLLRASADTIAAEIHAQITLALRSGITPTHLDSHTFSIARPEYAGAYARLGRRFGMPFLINSHWYSYCPADEPGASQDVVVDNLFLARRKLSLSALEDYYLWVLRNLKAGLNQLIVHPGFDETELRAITKSREAYGAAWRQRDFEIVRSRKFKSALRENNIQVIHWGLIKSTMEVRRCERMGSEQTHENVSAR
jgi:chitin disaccharide deacetylase